MKMTIEKAITVLGMVEAHGVCIEAKDIAVETMRKYQKIEQIVNEYNLQLCNNTSDGAYNFQRIREVIEDGNE